MKKIICAAILAVIPAAVYASGEAFTELTEAAAPAALAAPAAPEAGAPMTRSVTEGLGAAAQVKISDILPGAPGTRNTLLLLDTKTGKTFAVVAAGGGFVYNGKFYAAVYNGAGYILPSGEYFPVVGGSRAEGQWAAIVERALAFGLIREQDEYIPASRYFADLSGAADVPHKADYFSVWGYTDSETGAFLPDFVTMVSEDWAINSDGNWRIDQWLHWMGLDGAAQRAQHTVLIEDMDGRILGMETENPAPGAPAATANRDGLIGKWFLYQPANK